MRKFALASVLMMAVLAPSRAQAVTLGLDLGGGVWLVPLTPQFDFHFKVQFALGKVVSFGLRPGILLNVSPAIQVGVPFDVYFRFHVSRLYFDLMGGLALLFGDAAFLRAHGAVGMGVFIAKGFAIGFEGGYLQNGAQLLARFSFNF
ncbi:MAG: hypothetical protein Q8L48_33405 [Archangium sp.]|nr:hypothetical protein [Archangium sp.]